MLDPSARSPAISRRCGCFGFRQAAIHRQIILGHAARGEALLEALADLVARKLVQPVDRADRALFVLDDEAR